MWGIVKKINVYSKGVFLSLQIFDLKDLNGYFKNNEKNTPKFIWKTWRNPGTLLVRNSGHPE